MYHHHFVEELRRHYTTPNEKYQQRFPDMDVHEIHKHKHALVFPLTPSELLQTKDIDVTRIENVPDKFTGRINPLIDADTNPLQQMPEIELLLLSMLACSLPSNIQNMIQFQAVVSEYWNAMFTIFDTCVDEIKRSTCPEIQLYRLQYQDHGRPLYLIPTADLNYPKSRFYAYPHLWSIFATIFGSTYEDRPSFYFTNDTPQTPPDVDSSHSKSPSPRHSPERAPSLPHPSTRKGEIRTLPYESEPARTPTRTDDASTLLPERIAPQRARTPTRTDDVPTLVPSRIAPQRARTPTRTDDVPTLVPSRIAPQRAPTLVYTPAGTVDVPAIGPERIAAQPPQPDPDERDTYEAAIIVARHEDADYDAAIALDLARKVRETVQASMFQGDSAQQQQFIRNKWNTKLTEYTLELANLRDVKLPQKRTEAVDAAVAVDRHFNATGHLVTPPAEVTAIAQRRAAIEKALAPLREENRVAALTGPPPDENSINTTQRLIHNMLNAHFRRRYGILESVDRLDIDDTQESHFSDLILPQNASLTLATYCVRNNVPIRFFSPAPTATATFDRNDDERIQTIVLDAEVDFSLSGFTTAPTVTLQNSMRNVHRDYRPAVAVAHIENGRLIQIELTDTGENCSTTRTVIISNNVKLESDSEKAIHEKIKNVLLTSICSFFWTEMYRERGFMPPLTRNGCQNETQLAHYDSNISDTFQVGYFSYQSILRHYSTYLESLCLYHVRESSDSFAGLDPQHKCIICNDVVIADLIPPLEGTLVKTPWHIKNDRVRAAEKAVQSAEDRVRKAQLGDFSESDNDLPHSTNRLERLRAVLTKLQAELALLQPPQEVNNPALNLLSHRKLCTYNCGCQTKQYMHPMCLFRKLETNAANMNNIIPEWRQPMSSSVKCIRSGHGACDMRFMYKDCLRCDGEHSSYLDRQNIVLYFPPVRLFEVTMETNEQTLARTGITEMTRQDVVEDRVEDQETAQAHTVADHARPARSGTFRFGPAAAHVGDMPETHIGDTVSSLLHETPSTDTDELLFPHM